MTRTEFLAKLDKVSPATYSKILAQVLLVPYLQIAFQKKRFPPFGFLSKSYTALAKGTGYNLKSKALQSSLTLVQKLITPLVDSNPKATEVQGAIDFIRSLSGSDNSQSSLPTLAPMAA